MGNSTTDELTQIQHRLIAAWAAGDPSFHERILSDDWSVIDPSGRLLTKTEMLRESFTGERSVTGEIDQIAVRDLGDWAIVTGRTRVSGTYMGEQLNVELRFTDVFTRTSGEWRCLASQGTLLNQ